MMALKSGMGIGRKLPMPRGIGEGLERECGREKGERGREGRENREGGVEEGGGRGKEKRKRETRMIEWVG